jgi:hypothetical protein
MKRFVCIYFLIPLCGVPAISLGAEQSETSTISWMMTYQGSLWPVADTTFSLTNGPAGTCVGFWLRPSDPGYQANYATLLAAQISKRAITVYALDDQLWTGSSTKYCLVDSIKWQS